MKKSEACIYTPKLQNKRGQEAKKCAKLGALFANISAFVFGFACVLFVNFALLLLLRSFLGDSWVGSVLWGIGAGVFSGYFTPRFFLAHFGAPSFKKGSK